MRISHRAEGLGRPYCSHHKVLPEESLAAEHPELLEEWDYEKNKGIDPYKLASGAALVVWWICSRCKHEWKAAINDRTRRGGQCFECPKGIGTSFTEQMFFHGARALFPDLTIKNRYHSPFGREIDVYIEELGIGLEPGSWILHRDHLDRDTRKRELAAENGIRFITIYEDFPEGTQAPFEADFYSYPKSLNLSRVHFVIRDMMREIFADYDIPDGMWDDFLWLEIEWGSTEVYCAYPQEIAALPRRFGATSCRRVEPEQHPLARPGLRQVTTEGALDLR